MRIACKCGEVIEIAEAEGISDISPKEATNILASRPKVKWDNGDGTFDETPWIGLLPPPYGRMTSTAIAAYKKWVETETASDLTKLRKRIKTLEKKLPDLLAAKELDEATRNLKRGLTPRLINMTKEGSLL